MGKGMSNYFNSTAWFGQAWGQQNWGCGPKAPTSPSPAPSVPSPGGSTGPTTTLTVTFQSEDAGYANAMGWYNARTGEAGILFKNTNDDGWNAGVKAGDSRSFTVLQSDADANNIGFFMIPNGANNLSSSLLSSQMKFQVGSNGDGKIVIDRQYGSDVVLSGNGVLFSNQVLNKGDYDYVSGTVGTAGQSYQQKMGSQSDGADGILGTMAWDDQAINQWGGSDRDFNDVVFSVTKSGGTNPPPNGAPTDIVLSSAVISENAAGAVVGKLSTVDPDAGNTHTYKVSDSRFEVVGGDLKLKSGVSLDFETESSVQLKVTTTDQGGLSYSENFTVKVTDVNEAPANSAPTDLTLSGATVTENATGAVVGTLTTTDPNVGDTFSYKVDDARFEVVGNVLQLKSGVSLNYEADQSVVVNVTTTDKGGLSYSEAFTIGVKDITEAPTDIVLSPFLVDENEFGAVVGTLTTVDDDAGDTHTYKVSDSRFEIVGDQLRLMEESFVDFESEPTVTLNVTSTDQQGNSFTKAITVVVNDLNEAPTNPIDDDAAADFVASDAAIGSKVGITASSMDPDAGDSFSYSLSNDAGGMFAINATTGVVTVAGALEDGTQTITVRATDSNGEYSESDFFVQVGEGVQQFMAFGSGGVDSFLLDLAQEAVTTLVGFNRANDRLSFSGVADANANGSIGLSDLFAMVSGVSDFGSGGDIVVDFTTGASLVLQGAGTSGGSVTSMSNLVSSPSTQYQFA
jgi:hypothetical protein